MDRIAIQQKTKNYLVSNNQRPLVVSQFYMSFPTRQTVEHIREQFPRGTRVELLRMNDMHAPPVGTFGTVLGVDDSGALLMHWDNGAGLSVIYGEDIVRIV